MQNSQPKFNGQVVPCTTALQTSWRILIMGPTGAGKSTFIEAFSGEGQSLGISKDQLSGFTQDVLCYELKNSIYPLSHNETPIYLIDTPGFSDSRLSEMEIINKVKGWMYDNRIDWMDNILYVSPITDTRVPGTKRRTIKMVQSLLRDSSAASVTIVTTMWDTVGSVQARARAESHFTQLRDDIWKDFVSKGANVARFQNDHTSAIDIVRGAMKATGSGSPLVDKPLSVDDPSAPFLYQELLNRISNCRQAIEFLRVDQLQLIGHPDPLLESVVVPQLQEANEDLAKFLGQMVTFGRPPAGFEGAPQQVIHQHVLDHVECAKRDIIALKDAKTHESKLDWTKRSNVMTTIWKAESRLAALSRYIDASGNPQIPSSYEDLMEVLEFLRPKVKTTFTGRVKEELTSLTKKFTPH